MTLPVNGDGASYFNRATNTAFTENCRPKGNDVVCTVRTLNNVTRLDHTKVDAYSLNSSGTINVISSPAGNRTWTPDTFNYDYRDARKDAKLVVWDASSPLAVTDGSGKHIVQNNVLKLSKTGTGDVEGCSIVPISSARGFQTCFAFNETTGTVTSSTAVTLQKGTISAVVKSSRKFDFAGDDPSQFENYGSEIVGSGPTYLQRSP